MASTDPPSEAAIRRFQNRIAVCAGGGQFVDGWVLGVIGPALPALSPELHLSGAWTGLLGASALIGVFLGGTVFGYLTDRFGRQKLYLADLLVFLLCSLLQVFAANGPELFTLRVLMGVAVGADYAISGALLSEFMSQRRRGPALASLMALWYGGYVLAGVFGYLLLDGSDVSARWVLASSAVPAAVVLLSRLGTPESPRWLAGKGRVAEATQIVRRHLGEDAVPDILAERPAPTNYRQLLTGAYRGRTLFTSVFWCCQIAPFFAISIFAPKVFASLGIHGSTVSELVFNAFMLVGSVLGVALINRVGRRNLLIWPFWVTAVSLLVLGVWPSAPLLVVTLCFAVFGLFNAGSCVLETVYPGEIFPTAVRASAIGFAAAMSRIGAAAGTFLLPMALSRWGVGPTMLLGCAVLVIGGAVSVAWAPETTHLSLTESSAGPGGTGGDGTAGTDGATGTGAGAEASASTGSTGSGSMARR